MKNYYLKSVTLIVAIGILLSSCTKEFEATQADLSSDLTPKVASSDFTAEVPQAYMEQLLLMVKQTPGWTPPVAARGFGYVGLALYEAVQPGIDGSNSMAGQLSELDELPVVEPGEKYHWALCANEALYQIILDLMPTASATNLAILEGIHNDFNGEFASIPSDIYDRSVAFGAAIADAIFTYSTTDGGHECYLHNFPADYIPPTGDAMWVPTPPAYASALQPYWGSCRTFVPGDADVAVAVPPYAFSTSPTSTMYSQAMETYNYVITSTEEQTQIALFWADDPGATFTPPGHAWSIAKQVIDYENGDLALAAFTYGKLGIALNDAFISCWNNKYIYNLIRPVTYIRNYIDASFTPIVGTPPFPEYTSGHSTNMGAFAKVMESIYGKTYAFTDDTHAGIHPARSFDSFGEATTEAAISRIYGGIHYKQACYQGVKMGHIIGDNVNALNWK